VTFSELKKRDPERHLAPQELSPAQEAVAREIAQMGSNLRAGRPIREGLEPSARGLTPAQLEAANEMAEIGTRWRRSSTKNSIRRVI